MDTSQAGEGALSVNIRAAGQEVRHSIQVKIQLRVNGCGRGLAVSRVGSGLRGLGFNSCSLQTLS